MTSPGQPGVQGLRRYLYWRSLLRQARAYIRANNLRAVASAMAELDRHRGPGRACTPLCALKGALIRVLYQQGYCVRAVPEAERPRASGHCDAVERPGPWVEFTFVVEGRRYLWRHPSDRACFAFGCAGAATPPEGSACGGGHLSAACRDALVAVVYEFVHQHDPRLPRPAWLPTLRAALLGERRRATGAVRVWLARTGLTPEKAAPAIPPWRLRALAIGSKRTVRLRRRDAAPVGAGRS